MTPSKKNKYNEDDHNNAQSNRREEEKRAMDKGKKANLGSRE